MPCFFPFSRYARSFPPRHLQAKIFSSCCELEVSDDKSGRDDKARDESLAMEMYGGVKKT